MFRPHALDCHVKPKQKSKALREKCPYPDLLWSVSSLENIDLNKSEYGLFLRSEDAL